MAGRRPKPTALKALAGNPGKRALNKTEPQPKPGIPSCPKHLDAEARREWKRISAELTTLGMISHMDRAALAAYCGAWSRWVHAESQIQKFGAVIKSPKSGFPIQNPYCGLANTSVDQMRKFAVEFGLTPASRSRLHVEPKDKVADPFEAFMAGIGAADLVPNDEPTPTITS
jgi:P27 family predicted phage terminase small subunit